MSMPRPASVIVSSVLSGLISLTARTSVVLPTPKPPTITIFTPSAAVLRSGARPAAGVAGLEATGSEITESNEHLLQERGVGQLVDRTGRGGMPGLHLARVQQIRQQDLHDADR